MDTTSPARKWRSEGKEENALLQGVRLTEAEEWNKNHPETLDSDEKTFLDSSLKKHYRGVWLRRGIVTAISIFAIIASLLGWYANEQNNVAKRQIILNYWINGITARDLLKDTLKASHYFIKTAQETEDTTFSKNAQLAGHMLARNIYLKTLLEHQSGVYGAVFSANEERVLTWSADGTARVWDLQADDDFPQEHLLLQLQMQTGAQLSDVGDIETLAPDEWREQKQQYEEIAREHLKTGNYPRANLFLNHLISLPDSCKQPAEWLQEVNSAVISEAASKYAQTCLNRGNFHLGRKDYDQARQTFETTLQLRADYLSTHSRQLAEAYERIARTLIESGQNVEKGMEYVQQSLDLYPHQQPKFALQTFALGYEQQGQKLKAAEAYLNLAREYVRWREYVPALDAYQQAINLHPDIEENIISSEYAELYYGLAKEYSKQEEYEMAVEAYEQAVQYGTDAAEIGKLLEQALEQVSDNEILLERM